MKVHSVDAVGYAAVKGGDKMLPKRYRQRSPVRLCELTGWGGGANLGLRPPGRLTSRSLLLR